MTKLFLFAHQDDEFGVFHEIEKQAAADNHIIIIYLTDGAYGRATATIRNTESIAVLKRLGVSENQIYFLGEKYSISNQALHLNMEKAFSGIIDVLKNNDAIDTIYSLAWEGGHPDHDATFILAHAVSKHLNNILIYQFPLYNSYKTTWFPFRLMVPVAEHGVIHEETIPKNKWLKHFIYFCSYPSQKKTWMVLLPFFIWHYVSGAKQQLQATNPNLFLEKAHAGRLLYEKRKWMTWADFRKSVNPFLQEHFREIT